MEPSSLLRRVLETASAGLFYAVAFTGGTHVLSLFFLLLVFTRWWPVVVVYVTWTVVFEWNTPKLGGRVFGNEFMRRLPLLRYIADYYPITLEKTADLDPQKNYIFGYHPHGFISEGAFIAFQTDMLGFRDRYPGIVPHMSIHSSLLNAFLYRDVLLSLGFVDVSRASLEYVLTQKGPGNSVMIVVGGAAEILDVRKDSYVLTLKGRKGFIRLALETGSPLVPVFGFGQNNVMSQLWNVPGSRYSRLQKWVREWSKKYLGIALSFGYCYGFLGLVPWRTPINVVVGSAIPVARTPNPTEQEIDKLHTTYTEKLRELFEAHRDKYGVPKDSELTFI